MIFVGVGSNFSYSDHRLPIPFPGREVQMHTDW